MKKGKFYYCDNCGKKLNKKRDYIRVANPFTEAIYDEIVITDLCEQCYEDSCDDR